MKHSLPKGDKKKKKEVALEIAKLEEELTNRHKKELEVFENGLTVSVLSSSSCSNNNGIGHVYTTTGAICSQFSQFKVGDSEGTNIIFSVLVGIIHLQLICTRQWTEAL